MAAQAIKAAPTVVSGWLRGAIRWLLGKPEGEARCMNGWWRVIAVLVPPEPSERAPSFEWTVQAPTAECAIATIKAIWTFGRCGFVWSAVEESRDFIPLPPD